MLAFSVVWVVLATAVVVLATVRRVTAQGEDDYLRVRNSESGIITQQVAVPQQLNSIDHWGKIFAALAVLYGLALLSGFVYVGWQNSQQMLK